MTRDELLPTSLVRVLQQHAREAYPHEAIGLVLKGNRYRPIRNIADNPEVNGLVPLAEVSPYIISGDLVAVAHSHPDGPNCPSEPDMRSQVAMAVPFIITSTDGQGCLDPIAWGDQLETPPLLGRGFVHGITDCYALIRDHRWLEFGERLPEFPRNWDWWLNGQSLYMDGFAKAGYHLLDPMDEPTIGDIFLAQVRSPVPNHAGVLVEPGVIMHHASARLAFDPTRLSKRVPLTTWQSKITAWVRRNAA
jgi:proteasome lid subunit RPN8/RPN11